jgi:putative hydrolase of the HAD superfamily
MRQRPDALVVDLDGVLRLFDPIAVRDVEVVYQLPPGTLLDIALRWELLQQAVTGRITHDAWLDEVAAAVADKMALTQKRSREAVAAWQDHRGTVDGVALDFVREVRAAGVPVGLATNSTARLDRDLADLGLADAFDMVVNSSVIGVHKPTREFFREVCVAMARPPEHCLFVDDEERNVRGARVAGLSAYRWSGDGDLPYLRAALGLE